MASFIKETFVQWMAQFQDSGQSITKDIMKRKERYKLTREKEEDMICEKIIDTKKQKTDDNKTFPRGLSQDVAGFTKITMDAYRDGSLVGQIIMLKKVQNDIQCKIDKLQEEYDQTEVGAILKKAKDG